MDAAAVPTTRRAAAEATEMTVVREGLTLTGLQTLKVPFRGSRSGYDRQGAPVSGGPELGLTNPP